MNEGIAPAGVMRLMRLPSCSENQRLPSLPRARMRGAVHSLRAAVVLLVGACLLVGCGGRARDDIGLMRDLAPTGSLRAAIAGTNATEAFMSAASPGVVSLFFRNDHYATQEQYLDFRKGIRTYSISDGQRELEYFFNFTGFVPDPEKAALAQTWAQAAQVMSEVGGTQAITVKEWRGEFTPFPAELDEELPTMAREQQGQIKAVAVREQA